MNEEDDYVGAVASDPDVEPDSESAPLILHTVAVCCDRQLPSLASLGTLLVPQLCDVFDFLANQPPRARAERQVWLNALFELHGALLEVLTAATPAEMDDDSSRDMVRTHPAYAAQADFLLRASDSTRVPACKRRRR